MRAEPEPKPTATNTSIADIMTRDVVCVPPDLDLESLTAAMLMRGFSGAPVVDGDRRPIGMVSKTDIVRKRHASTVREIMTPMAFTISESATIAESAALMAFEGTHRLPVVSREGVVVGIVSSIDVLHWIAETEGYLIGRPERR